jgi:hypothetical protein
MEYPAEFETFWQAYPKRSPDNPKIAAYKAWKTRLKEGVEAALLVACARNYHDHCRQTGKLNTEFVLMASTFLGPNRRFESFVPKAETEKKPLSTVAKDKVPEEPRIDARPWLRELIEGLAGKKRSPLCMYERGK